MRVASFVTGLRAHGAAAAPPGAPLRLSRETGRAYDPHSIAVAAVDGRRLGYLPPSHGRILAPLIDAGLVLEARVVEARAGANPVLRLEITPARA